MIVLVLLALALLAWTPGPGPAQAARASRIAVALANGQLALIDDRGRIVKRFAHPGGAVDSDPAWSPDGSRIVFSRTTDNYRSFHLYVMRAEGRGLRRLTSGRFDWRPDWSRDGRLIAYQSLDGLRTVRPDGTGSRLVVRGEAAWPAWTATGLLSFAWHPEVPADRPPSCAQSGSGCGWVVTVKHNGGGRRLIVRGRDARWSPDGRRITYTLPDGGVATATASGHGTHTLGNGHESDRSREGRRIVYTRALGRGEIWIMATDGSHPHRILRGAQTPAWSPR
jgi:Tol biopolymer transport system component